MSTVLFYVDPWVELGKPDFRLGAVKNQFAPIAQAFRSGGYKVELIANKFVCDEVERSGLLGGGVPCYAPETADLMRLASRYQDFSSLFSTYESSAERAPEMGRLLQALRGDAPAPDVVVVWESASGFMRHIYPGALVLNLSPGVFSRAPMPDTVSIDVSGFFGDSLLRGAWRDFVGTVEPADQDFALGVASFYFGGVLKKSAPFKRSDLDPQARFKKLVLLPLQVSDYFAFNDTSKYKNQQELLMDVLNHAPSDVGVVVTQYVSSFVADMPINDQNIDGLKSAYPNLIFDRRFNCVDSVSQILLPSVDAVISVSSSVGLQAALCGKPVMSPSSSHLRALCEGQSLKAFFDSLLSGSCDTFNYRDFSAVLMKHFSFVKTDTVFDAQWLLPRVEKALRCLRAGGALSVVQNSFYVDDSAYRQRFTSDRDRTKSYLNVLGRSGLADDVQLAGLHKEAEIGAAIANPSIRLVSFDIFDTLVQRALERPVDVFTLMEPRVREISGGKIQNFGKTRYLAERMARERKKKVNPDSNEVTLEEIYDVFVSAGDLNAAQAKSVMLEELRVERGVLLRKDDGVALLRLARHYGKRVILISDMYLPKDFLVSVLDDLGIEGYDEFYLSCEHDVRKHDGRLFDVVAREEGVCDMTSWLHIGDNDVSDIKMPAERGIATLRLVRGPEHLMRSKKYAEMFLKTRGERSLWDSMQLGLIAKEFHANTASKIFLDTHFSGQAVQLGYAGMGPLLAGFSIWLARQAKEQGVTDLYFLARDGDVMKQVFDVMAPKIAPQIKTHYIYASRRAAQVAGIDSAEAIMRMCGTQFHGGELGVFLTEKFGLDVRCIDPQVLDKHSLRLDTFIVKQDLMGVVLDFCLDIRDVIFEQARKEREAYLSYLEAHGLCDCEKPGLVDIGYAGSMQQALSQMLGRDGIHGFYFMSFAKAAAVHASGNPVHAYFGDFVEKQTHNHPICRLGLCFEMLFTNCDGSLVRFEMDGSTGLPFAVFDSAAIEPKRLALLPVVQRGAVAYAADMTRYFGDYLWGLAFDPQASLRVFVDFLERPGGRDAQMLEGWRFEDSFSGSGVRYAVPPREEIRKNPKIVEKAVWKQGAGVFGRRSDLFGSRLTMAPKAVSRSMGEGGSLGKSLVYALARRVLSEGKYRKLRHDPSGFWADSKLARSPLTKPVYRFVIRRIKEARK